MYIGVVAQDSTQCEALWKLREKISLALSRAHTRTVFKYDLSVPMLKSTLFSALI
jgi:hypothetical protein